MRSRCVLAAVLCAGAAIAQAASEPSVSVPAPTTYTNGTALPVAKRIGAQVYCGPTRGKYVQAFGVASQADAVVVPLATLRGNSFCAATYVAEAADSTERRESDFSVEFPMTVVTSAVPIGVAVTVSAPALCTTTCTVDVRR